MKTIMITVSETTYAHFRQASHRLGRPTPELIREAMEQYRRNHMQPRHDLRDFQPRSLGAVLQPLDRSDDLLEDMLDQNP